MTMLQDLSHASKEGFILGVAYYVIAGTISTQLISLTDQQTEVILTRFTTFSLSGA